MVELTKLIGIPFKLNNKDFSGCDCRGIVYLYFKHIKNKNFPFSDGQRVFLRNSKKDIERMFNALSPISKQVNFNELQEGDVVLLKIKGSMGALGVCINRYQVLHMDKFVGSCLTKLYYLRELFLYGFRLND